MMESKFKKAGAFITEKSPGLQSILMKVKALQLLQEKVKAYFEPKLAVSCYVANLQHNKLTFLVANASLATQLRYQSSLLLEKFSRDPTLKHIQQLEFKVRPENNRLEKSVDVVKLAKLSNQTAAIIRECAATIRDEKIKEIMLRIATHVD